MHYTTLHLYFDDVEVGQEWESMERTVTEADIVNFACLSGDFNPIHMNREYAKTTAFRQPMAHGLLVWAISSGLGTFAPPMRTLAFVGIRDWQFKEPVYVGDTIRLRTRVLEKEPRARGRRGLITWHRQVLKQNDKIAQEGTTMTLVQ